jgi:hypothetical protein
VFLCFAFTVILCFYIATPSVTSIIALRAWTRNQPDSSLHLSRRSIARYGLAIGKQFEKDTTSAMENAVSASIMFDEASDIQMNKKLNVFVNLSHNVHNTNLLYSYMIRCTNMLDLARVG